MIKPFMLNSFSVNKRFPKLELTRTTGMLTGNANMPNKVALLEEEMTKAEGRE